MGLIFRGRDWWGVGGIARHQPVRRGSLESGEGAAAKDFGVLGSGFGVFLESGFNSSRSQGRRLRKAEEFEFRVQGLASFG